MIKRRKVTNINRQIILRVCCGVCLVGLLAGCAMLPKNKIAKSATNYNLVVERAENEMLLLNIVRASMRHPMYFTGLTTIRGSLTYEITTGEVTIPFGKIGTGLNGAYSAVSPVLKYSSNPVFDVAVLDNKEFYNALMTPVPQETFYYFLQLGWPKEMLLHLFILRIDSTKNGAIEHSYLNTPDHQEKFNEFQGKLREIFPDDNWYIEAKKTSQPIGDKINAKDTADLEKLIEVPKAGLELKHLEGKNAGYQLSSSKTEYKLIYKDKNKKEMRVGAEELGGSISLKEKDKKGKEEDVYIFYIRSPEAILYYLGEIMRAEIYKGFTPMIKTKFKPDSDTDTECKQKEATLFVVHKKTFNDKSPFVTVSYEGTKYVIPSKTDAELCGKCCEDRSMHVLSLVSLIIGKQKTYAPAPTTGVVSTIGR